MADFFIWLNRKGGFGLALFIFFLLFFSDFKEQTFSAIFKDYDKFKKQKIAEFEKEEIDYED